MKLRILYMILCSLFLMSCFGNVSMSNVETVNTRIDKIMNKCDLEYSDRHDRAVCLRDEIAFDPVISKSRDSDLINLGFDYIVVLDEQVTKGEISENEAKLKISEMEVKTNEIKRQRNRDDYTGSESRTTTCYRFGNFIHCW